MEKVLRSYSRVYFRCLVSIGLLVLAIAGWDIVRGGTSLYWLLLACLTAVSGRFTVSIPHVKSKISVAEIFIFTNMILFGPAVGAMTAALDGLLERLQSRPVSRHMKFIVFNIASMALSAFLAGKVFFLILGRKPIYGHPAVSLQELILPAGAMALVHYIVNTGSVAAMIGLEDGKKFRRIWW